MEKNHHLPHHPNKTKKSLSARHIISLIFLAGLCLILLGTWIKSTNSLKPQKQASYPFPTPVAFATQPPVDKALQKGPYNCPISLKFCKSGINQDKDGIYLGIGWKVASSTPILASFDGNINSIQRIVTINGKEETITTAILNNNQRGLHAIYYYKGELPTLTTVKAGDTIAKTGNTIAYYNNVSLFFQLIKGNMATGQRAPLTTKDFK